MSAKGKPGRPNLAHKGRFLTSDQAVTLMHNPESRLARMNTATGPQFFILPKGGRVKDGDAKAIIDRPDIVGPGLDQTFRMKRGG
jgi:hypothetical protein